MNRVSPTFKKVLLNTRVSEDIYKIFQEAKNITGLETRQFIELAILQFTEKLEDNKFYIKDLDLQEYSKIKKIRMLREMQGLFRTEIKSRALFIQRVETDILEMLLAHTPLIELKRFILARKLEAYSFQNPDSLIIQLEKFQNITDKDYKKTILELRQKFNDNITFKKQTKYIMKQISPKVKNK